MQFRIESETINRPEHDCYDDDCDGHVVAPDPEKHDSGYHYDCSECGSPFIIHLHRPGTSIRLIIF